MALNVTPRDGAPGNLYTIEFENKSSLYTDLYDFEVRPRTAVGNCPAPTTTGQRSTAAENSFLATDTFTTSTDVALGSCSVLTALIRNVETGTIVSQQSVSVDNLE